MFNARPLRIARYARGTFAFLLLSICTVSALASDTIAVVPSDPIATDQITISIGGGRVTSPTNVDDMTVSVNGSSITVFASLFLGDFSVPSGYRENKVIGSLPAGQYSLQYFVREGHDFMQYGPFQLVQSLSLTVAPVPPPPGIDVVEYRNAALNHYFMTANGDEIAWLDANVTTLGWMRTQRHFTAYLAATAPAAASPVCRFYGSVNPGPNSHFYSADADECNSLKVLQQTVPSSQPRWNFEETSFYIHRATGGQCPDIAPTAVYRLYNNRALFNDSNHRYVTEPTAYDAMKGQGWIGEGVVMCSSSTQ